MATIETISGVGAGPAWKPLGTMDYGIIGATTVIDVTAALFIVHVVWNAGWPPYTAADPQLLVYTSMAAIVATFGVSMRYGLWGSDGEALGCDVVASFTWIGLGALFSTAFLRVYRAHDVLVRQDGAMWPVVAQQLALLLLPFTLAPAFLSSSGVSMFDPASMECQPESTVPESSAFVVMGILAAFSLVLAVRLRVARVQAPYEFETAVAISIILGAAATALPLVHWEMEGDRDGRRGLMLLITALTGVGVAAVPALRFLYSYVGDEEKLKSSGDFCIGEWRSKKKVDHIIMQCRKFQEVASSSRDVPNFPVVDEFFRALVAREEITSYPKLQSTTMRILDKYFRKGVLHAAALPISEACITTTLQQKASSTFIFDRARAEVLDGIGIGKLPQLGEDEPVEPSAVIARTHSAATTGASPNSNSGGSGQHNMANKRPSPASQAAASAADADAAAAIGGAHLQSPSPSAAPTPAPPSPVLSEVSSLQYSEDSTPSHSPAALSPLHPLPLSRLNPDTQRNRSSEVRSTPSSPITPLTQPLDYRGGGKKKESEEKPGSDNNSGGKRKSLISSLFGRIGGGEGGGRRKSRHENRRVQDLGSSAECSPPIVHMAEEDDDEVVDFGDGVDGAKGKDEGALPRRSSLVAADKTGVRTMAGIGDVHAAFGLDKGSDDEEDGEEGGAMTQLSNKGGGDDSSDDGATDLAEASRAIPRPLFGDPSRAVGRQNARRGGGTIRRGSGTTRPRSALRGAASSTVASRTISMVPDEQNQDLANAYGLDLEAAEGLQTPPPADTGDGTAAEETAATIAVVNPLFGEAAPEANLGGTARGNVLALARAFDVEAQAQAVSAGLAVDNNKIGPPGRAGKRLPRKGTDDGGLGGTTGGGDGDDLGSSRKVGFSESPAPADSEPADTEAPGDGTDDEEV
ncbi:unnamed protein product [Ectocarpus sp. 12 AP-2014]